MKEIKDLKLNNNPFFETTVLPIFSSDDISISYIYGKNGSGKTSISNAIRDIKQGVNQNSLSDKNGDDISFTEDDLKHIFVFNEDFVDENVKKTSDKSGIDAILLFGEVADLDEQIKEFEKKISDEENNIRNRHVEVYHQAKSGKCIEDIELLIKESLKSTWAQNSLKIRKGQKASPVNEKIFSKIIDIDISKKDQKEIRKEFDSLLLKITQVKSTDAKIDEINLDFSLDIKEEKLIELLNKTYDKHITNDLINKIVEANSKYKLLNETKEIIRNNESYCPLCFNDINNDYRNQIRAAIADAFDETTRNAIAALEFSTLKDINIDIANYAIITQKDIFENLSVDIETYDKFKNKYRTLIERKISNIYDSLEVKTIGIEEAKNKIICDVEQINELIRDHNNLITNYNEAIARLDELNEVLAAFQILPLKNNFFLLKKEESEAIENNKKSTINIESYRSDIQKLNQKKKDYDIAKDEINKELSYIFASKDRLFLKQGDDSSSYYVYSKGKKVSLKKLSTGERNIITLCYFFEKMKEECKQNEYFKDELFVVIDDPISSFDYENKLSVFSYIAKMIKEIYSANKGTKFLIMSHERNAIYSFFHLLSGFKFRDGSKIKTTTSRISNKSIVNLNLERFSDYSELFREVYEFGCIDDLSQEIECKGNEVRRLVEAYSTFNYKCGPTELFSDNKFLSLIAKDNVREYFKTRLTNLSLDFDSHSNMQMKQYPNLTSFDMFSEEEQIKLCRDIICYIYCIDKNHILSYFEPSEVATIESWIQAIEAI